MSGFNRNAFCDQLVGLPTRDDMLVAIARSKKAHVAEKPFLNALAFLLVNKALPNHGIDMKLLRTFTDDLVARKMLPATVLDLF